MLARLQTRLTLIAFAAMLIAGAVAAALFLGVLERSLVAEIDQSITNRALDIAVEIDITNELDSASFPNDPETFVGVIEDPGGEPLLEIHNDDAPDVAALLAVFAAVNGEFDIPVNASIASISLTEGADNLRIVFGEVETGDEIIAVARTLDGVDRTLGNIRNIVALAVPLLAAVVAALVYALSGRALRPVEQIRLQVDEISAGDLSKRVPEGVRRSGQDEISRLAATMNQMLGRLESAQATQRRFTSDAAHELRTPLASMRAQLDVDLAHPELADWPTTATRVHGEVERMQRLVEDLLHLARSDGAPAKNVAHPNELVDLDDLLLIEVGSGVWPSGVVVDSSAVSAASVRGNADDLRRILSNLLANAARHARSVVAVSCYESDGQSILMVDDDGPGIAASDRERVFERFVRLDEARNRDRGGSGLGLALAKEIAEAHGGTLHVEASGLGGASFVLRVPTPS